MLIKHPSRSATGHRTHRAKRRSPAMPPRHLDSHLRSESSLGVAARLSSPSRRSTEAPQDSAHLLSGPREHYPHPRLRPSQSPPRAKGPPEIRKAPPSWAPKFVERALPPCSANGVPKSQQLWSPRPTRRLCRRACHRPSAKSEPPPDEATATELRTAFVTKSLLNSGSARFTTSSLGNAFVTKSPLNAGTARFNTSPLGTAFVPRWPLDDGAVARFTTSPLGIAFTSKSPQTCGSNLQCPFHRPAAAQDNVLDQPMGWRTGEEHELWISSLKAVNA